MSGIALKKIISIASPIATHSHLAKVFKCSLNTISSDSFKSIINHNNKSLNNINKNELVIDYLRASKIKYCQGWNTFNLYVCSQAEDLFHLNKNTGKLNTFF